MAGFYDDAAERHCNEIVCFLKTHPNAWTQGVWARDPDGGIVYPCGDKAASWCALGLLEKFVDDVHMRTRIGQRLEQLITRTTLFLSVPAWNDWPERTADEVIGLYQRAARSFTPRIALTPDWIAMSAGIPPLVTFESAMEAIEAVAA